MSARNGLAKKFLGPAYGRLRPVAKRILSIWLEVAGGGPARRAWLVKLLNYYFSNKFRREWLLCEEPPHFFDHQGGMFQLAFGPGADGPYAYARGFFAADLIRPGDRLLDIGCGDGFFDRRFFAARCERIDAIDIEPTAIAHARQYHQARNIRYFQQDAVTEPFPEGPYEVVVWDGALGHFPPDAITRMMGKIAAALSSDGVFIGSESLGHEGTDHLQYFETLHDIAESLRPHFHRVQLRTISYPLSGGTMTRMEAYWRCSNDPSRLEAGNWQEFQSTVGSREKKHES